MFEIVSELKETFNPANITDNSKYSILERFVDEVNEADRYFLSLNILWRGKLSVAALIDTDRDDQQVLFDFLPAQISADELSE